MIIKEGQHAPNIWERISESGLQYGVTSWKRRVTFTPSCSYDIEGEDMYDWNKLGGLSFGFDNHYNSVRYGWRWSASKSCIELAAYVYHEGHRIDQHLTDVRIGEPVNLELKKIGCFFKYIIDFKQAATVPAPLFTNKWVLGQGPYFGGNKPAPHDIEILLFKA